MSTDAGNAAAPEDTATRDVASERPGLESSDPDSADSATATPESADRGVEGSAGTETDTGSETDAESDTDAGSETRAESETDAESTEARAEAPTPDPSSDGFVAGLLRDSTITGLPGDTGPSTDDA